MINKESGVIKSTIFFLILILKDTIEDDNSYHDRNENQGDKQAESEYVTESLPAHLLNLNTTLNADNFRKI